MKRMLQRITFYYLAISSVSAYLLTVVSVLADQKWHEYFVSPVYLFCQLFAAGWILKMPVEIILSLLPLVFICISFVLYLKKNPYFSMFVTPVLLSIIVFSGILLTMGAVILGLLSLAFGVALMLCLHSCRKKD